MDQRSTPTRGRSTRPVLIGILIAALLCAGLVSYYASSQPDGLNKVAADQGFDANARDHDLEDSPFAGYATAGVSNERLSKGLSGVVGVVVTLLIGTGVFALVRGRSGGSRSTADRTSGAPPGR